RHRTLQRVVDARPAIENTAADDQAIDEGERRHDEEELAQPIRPAEPYPRFAQEKIRFERRVANLRCEPTRYRLAIIVDDGGAQRFDSHLHLDALRMPFLAIARADAAEQDHDRWIESSSQRPTLDTVSELRSIPHHVGSRRQRAQLADELGR